MFEILDARSPHCVSSFSIERGSVAWTVAVHATSRLTSSRSVRLFTCQRAHKQLHTSVKTFVSSVVIPVRGGGILSSRSVLSTAVAKIFPQRSAAAKSAGFRLQLSQCCKRNGQPTSRFAAVQAPRQTSAVGLNPTKAVQSVTGGLCFAIR